MPVTFDAPPAPAASDQAPDDIGRPRRIASRDRQCCRRCGHPVPRGTVIERVEVNGRATWIHAVCPGDHAAPPAPLPPAPRDDTQVQRLRADLESLRADLAAVQSDRPTRIEVVVGSAPPVVLEEAAHPALEEVLFHLAMRQPVFLPGPTGSGKSHLARQAATAMGLQFGSISCSGGMSESHLVGRLLPRGPQGQFEFVGTAFLECYENGGVFLFDEMDAADPNVLLCVNSALANGEVALPSRPEAPVARMHEDFRCVAAANTFGRGADRKYAGRAQLDESTLSRFQMGVVPVDYDRTLERKLWLANGCSDVSPLERLWQVRDQIDASRLERTLSTRFLIAASRVLAAGKPMSFVLDKLTAGWRDEEVRRALAN